MSFRIGAITPILAMSISFGVNAKDDNAIETDSIPTSTKHPSTLNPTSDYDTKNHIYSPTYEYYPTDYSTDANATSDFHLDYDFINPGTIVTWDTGSISAGISQHDLYGLMGIENGNFSLRQDFGKFTLTGYAAAIKYGTFRNLRNSYGFGGTLYSQINDNVGISVFGSYYSPIGGYISPASMGYINVPRFGGYVDITINERWGVKVGAQSYRSLISGHWESQPMVTPYFKINGQNAIGIDVGGILYNLLRDNIYNYDRPIGNPTIAPPIPSFTPWAR